MNQEYNGIYWSEWQINFLLFLIEFVSFFVKDKANQYTERSLTENIIPHALIELPMSRLVPTEISKWQGKREMLRTKKKMLSSSCSNCFGAWHDEMQLFLLTLVNSMTTPRERRRILPFSLPNIFIVDLDGWLSHLCIWTTEPYSTLKSRLTCFLVIYDAVLDSDETSYWSYLLIVRYIRLTHFSIVSLLKYCRIEFAVSNS
jgi:hypothetical protein